MKDYHKILGVKRNASDDEIKKAYRRLSMKHHPDRGGSEEKFKEIKEAYEKIISGDAEYERKEWAKWEHKYTYEKAKKYADSEAYHHAYDDEDLWDRVYEHFRKTTKNKDTRITIKLDLSESLHTVTKTIKLSGRTAIPKIVDIKIPAGTKDGEIIKYPGMGQREYARLPAGNLLVRVVYKDNPNFKVIKDGPHIETTINVNAFDLMLGANIPVKTIDGTDILLKIPKATQPNQTFKVKDRGLRYPKTNYRGDMFIKLNVRIPNLSEKDMRIIRSLDNISSMGNNQSK